MNCARCWKTSPKVVLRWAQWIVCRPCYNVLKQTTIKPTQEKTGVALNATL